MNFQNLLEAETLAPPHPIPEEVTTPPTPQLSSFGAAWPQI